MLKSISWFLVSIFIMSTFLFSQTFNQPESVVYDKLLNCYFVSNNGDGSIIKIDGNDTSTKSIFYSGFTGVRGLTLAPGAVLVAATNEGVVFFELATNTIFQTVAIPGMVFLNDITFSAVIADGGTLYFYVSDSQAGKVYQIRYFSDWNVSTLASGLNSPNGLISDYANQRLLCVPMVNDAPILAISLNDGSISTIKTTTLDQPDGIAIDELGNYYISYWGDNSIYRYDPNFISDPVLVSSGHNGPADISLKKTSGDAHKANKNQSSNDILMVPNFNGNTVEFIDLTNLSSDNVGLDIPDMFQLHQNFPNPFNPSTIVSYEIPIESDVEIVIFDITGNEIQSFKYNNQSPGHHQISWNGFDNSGTRLSNGTYFYQLKTNNSIQTKKMVVLK